MQSLARNNRALIAYFSVALLTAAYLFPFVRIVWGIGDEGIALDGARRVLEGQLPARDFVEVVAPGAFWWPALLFKVFGLSVVVAHAWLWLTGVLIAVIVFHLARRISGNAVLCAAFYTVIGIPCWPGSSYHWDATLFSLLTFLALVEWQRSSRNWLLIASGLSAAVTTLIMQHKGVLMLLAVVVTILVTNRRQRKKAVMFVLLPYLTITASVIAFYALRGALGDLVWVDYIWPSSRYLRIAESPYAFLFPSMVKKIVAVPNPAAWMIGWFLLGPLSVVAGLPALLIGATLMLLVRAFPRELISFWICGAALWGSELQKPDLPHLIWGSPILLILLFRFLDMMHASRLISTVVLASLAGRAAVGITFPLHAHTRIESRSGPFWYVQQDNALMFIQKNTRPGDPVFIYPYYAMYNFLSNTENPTRFTYFVYGWNTPTQMEEAVESLETKHVRYVLWSTPKSLQQLSESFPAYRTPARSEQIIEPYLESHYRQIGVENGFRILERDEYVANSGSAAGQAMREQQFVSSR